MAKKQTTELVKQVEEPQELEPIGEVPADLVRDSGKGTENIGADDVRPPRLMICQSGSPQRKPDDPKQIEGLNELDMFNDLSGEIYGRGPLDIVIIASLGSRYIEFAPMEEGGGVVDFNVPKDDPRTKFTIDDEGNTVNPIATQFYDYLVWLPDTSEILAFSLKSSAIKVAKKLNSLMKMPLKINGAVVTSPPAWARTYTLTTVMERDKNYAWGNYNLSVKKPVGITPPETRQLCSELAEVYKTKNVHVAVDDGGDDTFDTAAMDAADTRGM